MKQVYFKDKTLTLDCSNAIKSFVPREILTDKKLSAGARLLYAYIFSLPSGWVCHLEKIGQELGISKNTMSKYFKEILLAQEHQVQQLPLQAKIKEGVYATDFTHLQEEKSCSKKYLFTITNEPREVLTPKTYLLALAFNPFLKRQHQSQNLCQKHTIEQSQNLGTIDRENIIFSKENKNTKRSANTKPHKKSLEAFVAKLENFTPQEKEAIVSWLTYKKERAKRGIFTLEQIKRQITKIQALKNNGQNIITCIDQSLEYGWLGLFEVKAHLKNVGAFSNNEGHNYGYKATTQKERQSLEKRLAKIEALRQKNAQSAAKDASDTSNVGASYAL